MDWSKAKNILIIALIATNIFLGFTLFEKEQTPVDTKYQNELLKILESKGIYVNTELPTVRSKVPVITVKYSTLDNSKISEVLQQQDYTVAANDPVEMANMSKKFLEDCNLPIEDLFYTDVFTRSDGTVAVRFKNSYKSIAIGDSFVNVIFENSKITGLDGEVIQAHANGEARLQVTSPEEALLMLLSQKNSQASLYVDNIQLVYWVNDSDFDEDSLLSDTVFPAWQITYNGGQVKYFDAYRP